jgi:nitroimidazol reductase NimA-like FMN-containing flavoprotein (pyridoxamine 5'-phosphate oxidase superfamily)
MDIKSMPPSERSKVRRIAQNAHYDHETLYSIIDDAYVCHVAFQDEKGIHNIPTACWRDGHYLYIHGSNGSRMIKQLLNGQQACVTITHIDGLVLARAAFNHSMNYRSTLIYGVFELIDELSEKQKSLAVFMDKIALGRQEQVRAGNDKEFAATSILRISLNEAACKTRSGGPKDDDEDMSLPVWSGVLPILRQHGSAIIDEQCTVAAPDYVAAWDK